MKSGRAKLILAVAAAFCIVAALISIHGINKTIDRTVPVKVYEDNGYSYTSSYITILGNLKKTLFSTSFVGTFAIECYEPSCRDGVEAKIEWDDPDCPLITFSYAGNFSQLDVQTIDIDKDMSSMMVVLKDGTLRKIIISPRRRCIITKNRNLPVSDLACDVSLAIHSTFRIFSASISAMSRSWSRRSDSSAWNSESSSVSPKAMARRYIASASSTASWWETM